MALWVEQGDTYFTHSDSLLGRLIRWGETDHDEEPAWTNHTGVVVESGWLIPPATMWEKASALCDGKVYGAVVVEALGHVRNGPLKLSGVKVRVFRPKPVYTRQEKARFVDAANAAVGQRYGWWKLTAFLLKKATRGVVDFTKVFWIKDRPICSYLAAFVNEAARPIGTVMRYTPTTPPLPLARSAWPGFGMEPQCADPDEQMDFALDHPEFWEEVK